MLKVKAICIKMKFNDEGIRSSFQNLKDENEEPRA